MKKLVLIILIIIFGISLGTFSFLKFKTIDKAKQNKKLENDYEILTSDNNILKEENVNYEERINELKNEKANDIKEKEIWEETKTKLENALS